MREHNALGDLRFGNNPTRSVSQIDVSLISYSTTCKRFREKSLVSSVDPSTVFVETTHLVRTVSFSCRTFYTHVPFLCCTFFVLYLFCIVPFCVVPFTHHDLLQPSVYTLSQNLANNHSIKQILVQTKNQAHDHLLKPSSPTPSSFVSLRRQWEDNRDEKSSEAAQNHKREAYLQQ